MLSSCETFQKGIDPIPSLARNVDPARVPGWANNRIRPQWWKCYGDPALDSDVEVALENSPTLIVLAQRLEKASALSKVARAAAWPRLNLGFGYRPGEAQEVDFGPYEMAPWQSGAQFQWELDLWGKLKLLKQSANSVRQAAFFDLEAARLLLAGRIVEARFRLYRIQGEKRTLSESIEANSGILKVLSDREKAGILSQTDVLRARGEHKKLKRGMLELDRLEQLAQSELHTLRGRIGNPDFAGNLPGSPKPNSKSLSQLLQSHPTLLAAEHRVRSAFQLEESTRLNLLPTFTLTAGATGRAAGFLLDDFLRWETSVGPSLDIPIFDPARLAALDGKKANTREVAARYREQLLQILQDVESSYLSWINRRGQLALIEKESRDLETARRNVRATFESGIVSLIEVLEAERSALAARRAKVVLLHALLQDHLSLMRAIGGGANE